MDGVDREQPSSLLHKEETSSASSASLYLPGRGSFDNFEEVPRRKLYLGLSLPILEPYSFLKQQGMGARGGRAGERGERRGKEEEEEVEKDEEE